MLSPLLNFESLGTSEADLREMRQVLFKTTGDGYVLIKGFLSPELVEHVSGYWNDTPPSPYLFDKEPSAKKHIGQKPFIFQGNHRICYHNYLWNRPMDEISHSVCFIVTMLRNQLEQQPIYRHLLPNASRMASYRVVTTHNVQSVEVEEHTDWIEDDLLMRERHLKFLLQGTLFLSSYGKDYEGDGFTFYTNRGEKIRFGPEIPVEPGDLLLWRYANVHGVGANQALPGGRGFSRMLFPYEDITLMPVSKVRPGFFKNGKVRLEKIFRGLSPRRLKKKLNLS